MKTIGLLGGMSWESTVTYYQLINTAVKERLGGLHSAKCLLYSVDFHEIESHQSSGAWERCGAILADSAARLERAGADFMVICTNTMHKVAPQIEAALHVPLLHIADATAAVLEARQVKTVALLGTKYTMLEDFYRARLQARDIQVLIPGAADVELVNAIIFDELCLGMLSPRSKAALLRIITQLAQQGAQGVVLGCTELGLLVTQEDTDIPLFDTTHIHATQAALFALEG